MSRNNVYTELYFKISIYDGDNERNTKLFDFCSKLKGHNSANIIRPDPNSNFIFYSRILYTEYQ